MASLELDDVQLDPERRVVIASILLSVRRDNLLQVGFFHVDVQVLGAIFQQVDVHHLVVLLDLAESHVVFLLSGIIVRIRFLSMVRLLLLLLSGIIIQAHVSIDQIIQAVKDRLLLLLK